MNRESYEYAVGQSDPVILSSYPRTTGFSGLLDGDLMRILHLDTFSTVDHPSPVVQAGKTQKIMAPAVQLIQAGICHRETRAAQV